LGGVFENYSYPGLPVTFSGAMTMTNPDGSTVSQPIYFVKSGNSVPAGLYNIADTQGPVAPPAESVGYGYGSVTVSPNGQATVAFHLPDGSALPVTFSTPVRSDGTVVFFAPLYNGGGLTMGTVSLAGGNVANQGAYWLKSAKAHNPFYPDGFKRSMALAGSKFTSALTSNDFTSQVLELNVTEGAFSGSLLFAFIPAQNQFVLLAGQTNGTASLTYSATTGLISGTATFKGHAPFKINAAEIGGQALGYALGTADTATVTIHVANPHSLGNYDDGFVLVDSGGGSFLGFPVTGYFGYDHAVQHDEMAATLTFHKAYQLQPHLQLAITDVFSTTENIDVLRNLYGTFPAPGYVGPYNHGINIPTMFKDPGTRTAVMQNN
jgi:hypothetical protein